MGVDLARRVGLAPHLFNHVRVERIGELDVDRDQLTIVFSDLASSTRLSVEHGDEAYLQAIDASRRILRHRCTATGGVEFGTQGDGFLAYYRDPEAAIDFALAATGDVARISGTDGPLVALKLGVATGRPILRDNAVYGQTVNLAARLSDRAEPGQIVTDGSTRFQTERSHRFSTAGAVELKGFPDLTPTHIVIAARSHPDGRRPPE